MNQCFIQMRRIQIHYDSKKAILSFSAHLQRLIITLGGSSALYPVVAIGLFCQEFVLMRGLEPQYMYPST
jgi:hypothetical protein